VRLVLEEEEGVMAATSSKLYAHGARVWSESQREKDREGAIQATENERGREMKQRLGIQDDRVRQGGAHATTESNHVALHAYG
jgi:hypothetical protein